MKIKEKIKLETEKEIIKKAFCDFCGKEFDKITVECGGYGRLMLGFGYGSSFDDDTFVLEICDSCFLKMFGEKLKEQLKEKGYDLNKIQGVKNVK